MALYNNLHTNESILPYALRCPLGGVSEVDILMATSANGTAAGGTGRASRSAGKGRAAGGKAKARRAEAGEPDDSPTGQTDEPSRLLIANAITAILLHAEVVRRQADGAAAADADLVAISSRHIAENARRLWRALGTLDQQGFDALAAETGNRPQ